MYFKGMGSSGVLLVWVNATPPCKELILGDPGPVDRCCVEKGRVEIWGLHSLHNMMEHTGKPMLQFSNVLVGIYPFFVLACGSLIDGHRWGHFRSWLYGLLEYGPDNRESYRTYARLTERSRLSSRDTICYIHQQVVWDGSVVQPVWLNNNTQALSETNLQATHIFRHFWSFMFWPQSR